MAGCCKPASRKGGVSLPGKDSVGKRCHRRTVQYGRKELSPPPLFLSFFSVVVLRRRRHIVHQQVVSHFSTACSHSLILHTPTMLIKATSSAASKAHLLEKDPETGFRPKDYYGYCMVGGFAACGLTHALVTPLDVAKVRTQAYSKAGKWPNGLLPSIQQTWNSEGLRGLTLGWSPTLLGYGFQGLFKFGLNEFFKDYYTKIVGEETLQNSTVTKLALWAAASGSAEVFADVALCPFEMTKVRMQVRSSLWCLCLTSARPPLADSSISGHSPRTCQRFPL